MILYSLCLSWGEAGGGRLSSLAPGEQGLSHTLPGNIQLPKPVHRNTVVARTAPRVLGSWRWGLWWALTLAAPELPPLPA